MFDEDEPRKDSWPCSQIVQTKKNSLGNADDDS